MAAALSSPFLVAIITATSALALATHLLTRRGLDIAVTAAMTAACVAGVVAGYLLISAAFLGGAPGS